MEEKPHGSFEFEIKHRILIGKKGQRNRQGIKTKDERYSIVRKKYTIKSILKYRKYFSLSVCKKTEK